MDDFPLSLGSSHAIERLDQSNHRQWFSYFLGYEFDQTLGFDDAGRAGSRRAERVLHVHVDHATFQLRIEEVTELADTFEPPGKINTTFMVLDRTIVSGSCAFVNIHANSEPRRPFVTRLRTMAAHVDPISHQRLEMLILYPMQRAFPVGFGKKPKCMKPPPFYIHSSEKVAL